MRKIIRAFRRFQRILVFATGLAVGATLVIFGEDIPFFKQQDPLVGIDDYLGWTTQRQVFYATTIRLAVAKEAAMQNDRDFAIWLVAGDGDTKTYEQWHADMNSRVQSFHDSDTDLDVKTLLSLLIEDWHAEFAAGQ